MEEKIKDFDAWVARDEYGQLCVYFYDKPVKNTHKHRWDPTGREEFRYINDDKFPKVKWEDEEPTKVELTITICK